MNLKSFGCSFIFGTELSDVAQNLLSIASQLTWPAKVAKGINYNYQCYARPGSGNLQILERVLVHASQSHPDDIFVIGWSWIDRFDYLNPSSTWTMLPPLTPWETIMPVDTTDLAKTYFKELHSQYSDKLTTLIYMKTAIDVLRQHNLKFVMTYIDNLVFETEWQPNPAIKDLQDYIWPSITRFDGQNFIDWSRNKEFKISPTMHPLDDAHSAAADYIMQQVFDKKNTNVPTPPALS